MGPPRRIDPYLWAIGVVVVCTGASRLALPWVDASTLPMIYLLGVVFIATRFGRWSSIVTTVLGVLAFDFFCVPPYYSLTIDEAKYAVVFAGMMVVGVVVGTLTDRLRGGEKDAQEAKAMIELERQRNALLSVVSHDLRTPLAAITGAATALLEAEQLVDPQTRRDLLGGIAMEAGRLSALVANLLDMTRLESGALRPKREWQPIDEPIGGALVRLEGVLGERVVVLDVPSNLPLIAADGALIEQVITNLVDNCVKYAPDHGPIEIKARATPTALVLEIKDRGPGVPEEDVDRIFEKFYRVRGGGGRWGTGLGLSICRGIVEAHGGRITAANRAEGGLVFRVDLPLETPPHDVPGSEASR